jgi:hypothetical protein
MKRLKLAAILSTFCFLLAACSHDPKVVPLNLAAREPNWFVCEGVDPTTERPALPPAVTIDWDSLQTIPQAREAHNRYVARMVERNGLVVGYMVMIEGRLFTCANNMAAQRDFYDRLPPEPRG